MSVNVGDIVTHLLDNSIIGEVISRKDHEVVILLERDDGSVKSLEELKFFGIEPTKKLLVANAENRLYTGRIKFWKLFENSEE